MKRNLQKAFRLVSSIKKGSASASISSDSGLSYLPTDRGSVLLIDNPMAFQLETDPVPSPWILAGSPEATAKILFRSQDWLQSIVVWECTAGKFNWHYNREEILFVVSGHAVLTNESGEEREFGPGDVLCFPAGVSCTWLVRDTIRKVAIIRETLVWPLGPIVKAWLKLLRKAGLVGHRTM